jgi:phage-related protein
MGSLHEDLKKFPPDAQDEMRYALYVAQIGDKHPKAKPLK